MLFLSKPVLGPPKAPRNCFFPWFNFVLQRTGGYLEPNRVAFKVPVHMTKAEIREYLLRIYKLKVIKVNTYIRLPKIMRDYHGSYLKMGARFKRAFVTLEEEIPDEVKMYVNSRKPSFNPAIWKRAGEDNLGV